MAITHITERMAEACINAQFGRQSALTAHLSARREHQPVLRAAWESERSGWTRYAERHEQMQRERGAQLAAASIPANDAFGPDFLPAA
jgi:hypothetical protein